MARLQERRLRDRLLRFERHYEQAAQPFE